MVGVRNGYGNGCGYGFSEWDESAKIFGQVLSAVLPARLVVLTKLFNRYRPWLFLNHLVFFLSFFLSFFESRHNALHDVKVMSSPLRERLKCSPQKQSPPLPPMTQNPHTQCTYCNLSVPHGLGNVWRSGPAHAQLRGNGSRVPWSSPPQR